jgi:hypothetical protein
MKTQLHKHTTGLKKFSISSALTLAVCSLSPAAVVVSNLGELEDSPWSVRNTQYIGMSFTVGNDFSAWTLDSVDIRALNFGATTDFIVELHADSAGAPSVAALATLTGANPSITGNYNFTPISSITLTAGTTYWLTAESATSQYGWVRTTSTAESTALSGWSIGNNIGASLDSGASWGTLNLNPAKFAINATGIPEPSSLLLLGIGSLAIIRRKRAKH